MQQNKSLSLNLGQGLSLMIGLTTLVSWDTATRPKKAKAGTIGFNNETSALEYWDGTNWFTVQMAKI